MAKTINITDKVSKSTYTLEFTRKGIEVMEKQGFTLEEVQTKPVTMIPMLFRGAFYAHHRFLKPEVIDGIYDRMNRKEDLINTLIDMYSEPLQSLVDSGEDSEGNVEWAVSK